MRSIVPPLIIATLAGLSLGAVVERAGFKPQQGTLRADVNLVSIYFTVRDKREKLVTDLGKDAFKVSEDGTPQTIAFFAHHSDLPMNVGVLLDTSTGLSRTLGLEADAASAFFRAVMRPNDQGFLVSYASRIEVLQVPIEDGRRLADKAQTIRRYAKYDDPPAQSQRQPQPFPSPFPVPIPPQAGPDPASLRVAR